MLLLARKSQMRNTATTRQVLQFIRDVTNDRVELDNGRLKDWHLRGVLSSEPAGKGKEREYSFRQFVFLASLALFADKVKYLRWAREAAEILAHYVLDATACGIQDGPAYLVVFGGSAPEFHNYSLDNLKQAALAHGCHAGILVYPALFARQLASVWNQAGLEVASE